MSSAFINSLGSSFGSLTTTQTKSQSRTKKKTAVNTAVAKFNRCLFSSKQFVQLLRVNEI